MSRTLAALLVALSLVGCQTEPPGPPQRDKQVPPRPEPFGTLRLENQSGETLFRVRLRRKGERTWGADRLADADVVKEGQARSWELPAGTYEVLLRHADGSEQVLEKSFEVSSGGTATCTVRGKEALEGSLTITNQTPWAIARVYFSLRSAMGWGGERLGQEVLRPRQQRSWKVPAGQYNLRLSFQDDTTSDATAEVHPGRETVFRVAAE